MRKIYFYRTYSGTEESGLTKNYDPGPALAKVHALDWDDKGRYLPTFQGEKLMMWVDKHDVPYRLMLGKSRYSNLPHSEKAGTRSGIPLEPTAGINEVSHIVWFPNNIIGAEYNHHGPRIPNSLQRYLYDRVGDLYTVLTIEQLIYGRPADLIRQLDGLTLFNIRISRSELELLKSADKDLIMAMETQASAGDADQIGLTLSATRKKRAKVADEPKLRQKLADRIEAFTHRIVGRTDFRERLKSLKIAGPDRATGKRRLFNLLEDRFIVEETMLKINPRSRAVHAESAYEAIERAYTALRDDLEAAAGVS